MTARPAHAQNERGETLVEVLVAVVILGIAGVAILAGLQLSVRTSDIQRKQTTGGAYARDYAEAIERYVAQPGKYVGCAPANTYAPNTVGFGIQLPPGFTATQAAAKRVPANGGAAGTCSSNDTGVQQIDVTISSQDGRAAESLTVLLRKPCSASMAACS